MFGRKPTPPPAPKGPDINQLPDRMWVAVTALAASWTTPEDGAREYLAHFGRAVLVYQHARILSENGFTCTLDGEDVLRLHATDGFAIGMSAVEDLDIEDE